ncbi:hypothetical protein IEC97_21050 [Neobacillus cucumis]|uniref:hypothetical protein n=1 Tax=Neobacillus cucumis TaxID=1740721 RepID=UPI0018DFFAC5|nr:hypothetical protein [Neobacillus cucumis]MBI0579851.1 hypothetical protein [Neobacillus cucumis]
MKFEINWKVEEFMGCFCGGSKNNNANQNQNSKKYLQTTKKYKTQEKGNVTYIKTDKGKNNQVWVKKSN